MPVDQMNYEEFENFIKENITRQMNSQFHTDAYYAFAHEAIEGRMLTLGINDPVLLAKKESKGYVHLPMLPLSVLYEIYKHGMDIDEMVCHIADTLVKGMDEDVHPEKLFDYDYVKNRMFVACYNRKKHFNLVREAPHRNISDFSLCCLISMNENEEEIVQPVSNEMLEHYGISEDQLFEDAFQSTVQIKPVMIKTTRDLLDEGVIKIKINGEAYLPSQSKADDSEAKEVFALIRTDDANYGAAGLFYPGVLEEVAQLLRDDLTIVPRSLNFFTAYADEIIDEEVYDAIKKDLAMQNMQNPINLSNSIYHYCRNGEFETMESYRSKKDNHTILSLS